MNSITFTIVPTVDDGVLSWCIWQRHAIPSGHRLEMIAVYDNADQAMIELAQLEGLVT